jgi:ribonuclease HI
MAKKEAKVYLYTDGACSGNPGVGGWGALLKYKDVSKELSGFEEETTNNRMELRAVIEGLKALKRPCEVEITTDSSYVKNGIEKWVANWKKNGWKTSNKKPVKNVDLWQVLDEACSFHKTNWHWVKGHSGHEENEIADKLATDAIKLLKEHYKDIEISKKEEEEKKRVEKEKKEKYKKKKFI